MQKGFSLVELSIVLVILGLLTGGILAGQNLIRAAELRSISTQYNSYQTAVNTFRDKYFAIPGDMRNATSFWGHLTGTGCTNNTGAAADATNGTCDGDGDGVLDRAAAVSQSGENFMAWQQLAKAGLIEGTYTGITGAANAFESIIGENVPRARINNAGFSFNHWDQMSSDPSVYDGAYGNMFFFGSGLRTHEAAISTEEAWNIDTKMDDGQPAYGFVRVFKPAATHHANCATTNVEATTEYNLTFSGIACGLLMELSM